MDKSSYKSAEELFKLAEPQVRCPAMNAVTGYKCTFTFDGAEDVLVVRCKQRTLNNGWLHSKTKGSSRISEKYGVFPHERYV